MEGYRASLILALPEFDTYGMLPRFARNPYDMLSMAGFILLKERALRGIDWSLHSMLQYPVDAVKLLAYRLGSRLDSTFKPASAARTNEPKPATSLADMSESQIKELYYNALKLAGVSVDPAASMNDPATQSPSSNGKHQ